MDSNEIYISPEELREKMWRSFIKKNIVTEEDSIKKPVKEQPKLEKFVKVTSYLLENHPNLFIFFKGNSVYFEAVKLARRLAEEGIIDKKKKMHRSTLYYFAINDTFSMGRIDNKIYGLYPNGFIPSDKPIIRNKNPGIEQKLETNIPVKLENNVSLDSRVDEELDWKAHIDDSSEYITVSTLLRIDHRNYFRGIKRENARVRSAQITKHLAKKGVIQKQEKEYKRTKLYIRKDDISTKAAIAKALPELFTEDGYLRERKTKFISITKCLIEKHPELFDGLGSISSVYSKANCITNILAEMGVISKKDKSYYGTFYYICRDDVSTMQAIDKAIANGIIEKSKIRNRINSYKFRSLESSYVR